MSNSLVPLTWDDSFKRIDSAFVLGPYPPGTVIRKLSGGFDTGDTAAGAIRSVSVSLAIVESSPPRVYTEILSAISTGEGLTEPVVSVEASSQVLLDGQVALFFSASGFAEYDVGKTLERASYLVGHARSGVPGVEGLSSISGALGVDVLWPDESPSGFSVSQQGAPSVKGTKDSKAAQNRGVPNPTGRDGRGRLGSFNGEQSTPEWGE